MVFNQHRYRCLVIQPGAIGDCLLSLPLIKLMKQSIAPGSIDVLGHTEYTAILPGRTDVDAVRSIESVDLHRLFVEPNVLELADNDPLINFFSDYCWIVSFLGEPESNFEKNLIFTANCSCGTEVITIPLKPPKNTTVHISRFYEEQFITSCGIKRNLGNLDCKLINSTRTDINNGKILLKENGIDSTGDLLVVHPGSGGREKCWHLDNFLTIAENFSSKTAAVIFLLGPAEKERLNGTAMAKINKAGVCLSTLNLTQVCGLLACADWFIGNDSGITHLATGLGTKTAAIFGPASSDIYKPIGPKVKVFATDSSQFALQPSERLRQAILAELSG